MKYTTEQLEAIAAKLREMPPVEKKRHTPAPPAPPRREGDTTGCAIATLLCALRGCRHSPASAGLSAFGKRR